MSLLLCLLDWCMALPVSALLHPVSTAVIEELHPSRAPLLDYIYRVSPSKPWAQTIDLQIKILKCCTFPTYMYLYLLKMSYGK